MATATSQQHRSAEVDAAQVLEDVDRARVIAFADINPSRRSELGQYPTPMSIGAYMASLFERMPRRVRLLDPGAGVGSLTAAFIAAACANSAKPIAIETTAYEIEPLLCRHLAGTLAKCGDLCQSHHVSFDGHIRSEDFIESTVEMLRTDLWQPERSGFNCAILNPPYKKISSDSKHRRLLREVGVETSNLYTAFLALTIKLLEPEGEIVAITPRSFCNGPYFEPFRQLLLRELSIRRIHVFESRDTAFAEDSVLQEDIIFHGVRTRRHKSHVLISTSDGLDTTPETRLVARDKLVRPNDPNQFIHIPTSERGSRATDLMSRLPCCLDDIGLSVSTGRVVDFRCRQWLTNEPGRSTVPLIYPAHFSDGWIAWPREGFRKPDAYLVTEESSKWLIPAGLYVLTRRFSAKEEHRRIVAAVFDPHRVPCEQVAFENHINYFHMNGRGLAAKLASGLAAFLNSKIVDDCFRQFNGHTQVNASDLRKLRYPTIEQLEGIGTHVVEATPSRDDLDRLVEKGMDEWPASHATRKQVPGSESGKRSQSFKHWECRENNRTSDRP